MKRQTTRLNVRLATEVKDQLEQIASTWQGRYSMSAAAEAAIVAGLPVLRKELPKLGTKT
jgi:hypothetical protein